jgi:hypothetical protein
VVDMTIDVEKCLDYMFPSMIGVDINVGIAINVKGGDCWIMLSLMPKDLLIDVKGTMSCMSKD